MHRLKLNHVSKIGFPQVTNNEISWPFPDQVPIFTAFLQHENIFLPLPEFTRVTQMQKNLLQRPCGKKICMICHFNVPYQLNHDIIYKMSNTMEIYFRIFLHLFLATVRLSNHIMTLTVKIWGLHNGINSILPDFFLTFWWISKFPDTYQDIFKDFNLFLNFSWPVGTL